MKKFFNINIYAIICGLFLAIQYEFYINSGRFSRITRLPYHDIETYVIVFNIVLLAILALIIVVFGNKYTCKGALRFILTILWVPYFVLFALIIEHLFPIISPVDKLFAGAGFIVMGAIAAYPIYIVILLIISSVVDINRTIKK